MGISKRHHYIPQFLIKRFADENGMLYVFNKESKTMVREMRSTKSIFFEMNRNTVDLGGGPFDGMEKLYAALDEKFASALSSVYAGADLTEEYVADFLSLAQMLKWRIVANDEKFERAEKRYSFDDFSISIKADGKELPKEAMDHLLNSEVFKLTKRVIFPFLPFYENGQISDEKLLKAYVNSYLVRAKNVNAVLGDSPLTEDESASDDHFGNFILPLGCNLTFICSANGKKNADNLPFHINKDLIQFHQAEKYIVSKDKSYLQEIANQYFTLVGNGNLEQVSKHIFKFT